ncbi:MAG: tRNA (adenosine(37)-N6)-threonylcarbamoyltransferase complex transferase subunit TsaD [Candidatus Kerfeldbacteria bacterium]|nr:tRNA (adenosine(37)-N6)-threonylcarbamoyltransferase complex transferase subunit TsaD [Candidatus Kerfeldbacteria bacterium]
MKPVYILAIETSFDETAAAVLCNDRLISNVVSTQIDVHKEWGGVVPSLARREHEKLIGGCIASAFKKSGLKSMSQLSAIAVTYGPGLAPALEVGVREAKKLALELNIPIIPVNHMEGHALAGFLRNKHGKRYIDIPDAKFPLLAVCVSGAHSEIVWAEKFGHYQLLGQTLDDAAGEAFDKVGRMLDLGYPAGAIISELAKRGNPKAYDIPRPMKNSQDYNFSFSGLKTACLYQVQTLRKELGKKFPNIIPDYCASVQEAIVDSILIKTSRAVKKLNPKMVIFGGGVVSNSRLRVKARAEMKKLGVPLYFPAKQFCTDNAAMIGYAAYQKFLRGEVLHDVESLQRDPAVNIDSRKYCD